MKPRLHLAALVAAVSLFSHAFAQSPGTLSPSNGDAAPAPSPVATELQALISKVRDKLKTGRPTAESLAPELAEFDALLAKYPEKNDDTAQVAYMQATLYIQVLEDMTKGRELLLALKDGFPGTKAAAAVEKALAQMDRAAKDEAVQAALIGQPAPELNFIWSSQEGLKTLSSLKGRVVVLDFWATWCGPCIASFPEVREHVAHFKGAPVTFLGVTSIQGSVSGLPGGKVDTKGDPAREMALMTDFMKAKDMTWPVVFSEQEVFNPDYGIAGIPYVAIIAPDGTVRHAGLHPGNPASDIAGKIEALLKEFNLPVPDKA